MVWGHEEFKTERIARGFSLDSSRSLGRRQDRAAVACSFSAPMRPVVATPGGPPAEVGVKTESASSSEALQPEEGTRDVVEWCGGVPARVCSGNGENWQGSHWWVLFIGLGVLTLHGGPARSLSEVELDRKSALVEI
jgi:hypothetical protein